MTPEDLKAWRSRLGIKSQSKAGVMLGLGSGTFANYETGKSPIPRHLELACRCLEHEAHAPKIKAHLDQITALI